MNFTVIAAGFARWDGGNTTTATSGTSGRPAVKAVADPKPTSTLKDLFADDGADPLDDDDDFDVPSFLK